MFLAFKLLVYYYLLHTAYARTEQEIRSWFVSLGMECNKDYALSGEEMSQLNAHKIPESENVKCFLACLFKKSKWMNDKGMFDLEAAQAFVEKEHSEDAAKLTTGKKLLEECKKVNDEKVSDGEKGCERAALLMTCITEQSQKLGINMGV